MTAESVAPNPTINSNIPQVNSEGVSSTTIDEANYHTAPAELFPTTPSEERYNLSEADWQRRGPGEEYVSLGNINNAFATNPAYAQTFQDRMQASIKNMIEAKQCNDQFKPVISLQTVDYDDFSLKNTKSEYFQVDAPTLNAFKTSRALKDAGITVLGMPSRGAKFELVAYDQTGRPISGSDWNPFFEKCSAIIAQEQAQQQAV